MGCAIRGGEALGYAITEERQTLVDDGLGA
jgi:hypothetical protein